MMNVNGLFLILGIFCVTFFGLWANVQAQQLVFPEACVDCHGPDPKYPLRGIEAQYTTSGHKTIGNASYANGGGCQHCHTHEGFIEYTKTGKIDAKAYIDNPSQIGCFTCHAPHTRGDFTLRKEDEIKLANGTAFNKGKANLCANCHQARSSAQKLVKRRTITSAHWGPHHGPQADMVLGTNGYEFSGKNYSSSIHSALADVTCVSCHMAQPTGRYRLSPMIGGHSFRVEGEVHETVKLNAAGCLGSGCHTEMKQVKGARLFEKQAKADYDGDGKVEYVQEEVQGLYERLINEDGTGLLQTMKSPLYDSQGKFMTSKVEYPEEVVAAIYNYKFVREDRSRGIHNNVYAIQLLMDSIRALDPSFDTSRRP